MGLTRVVPANRWDALALIRRAALWAADAPFKSACQLFQSATIGWEDAEGTVVVLGFYPLAEGHEIWLAGEPDRARPHLKQIAQETRLTLAAMEDAGILPVIAHVRHGHAPGQKLARLCGFRPVASPGAAPGHFQRWIYEGRHGRTG